LSGCYRKADAVDVAELGGTDFAALIARSQRQGSEPCAAVRVVATSLGAEIGPEDMARLLRDRAKALLQAQA
jgi:hypothetical protein